MRTDEKVALEWYDADGGPHVIVYHDLPENDPRHDEPAFNHIRSYGEDLAGIRAVGTEWAVLNGWPRNWRNLDEALSSVMADVVAVPLSEAREMFPELSVVE